MRLLNSIEKVTEFFKSGTLDKLQNVKEILNLNVDALMGIDPIYAKSLTDANISTVKDLAELTDLPVIKGLPENILEKWAKTASMLLQYATKPDEKKILLLGLDNAGKTSIISILQKRFSIIKTLLPTRGVSRQTLEFLGTSLICWDFGGQIAYRNMYLSRPKLFLESDLVIFVIDIIDFQRYDEATEYLFQIMDLIKKLDEKAPLIVDLHKFDPDIQEDEQILKRRVDLIDKIASKALEMDFDCTFINTTIFIKETIEQLFSLSIQRMSVTNYILEHLVKDYMEKIDASACALMTNNSLVLSSYSKDPRLENIIIQSGLLLQALVDYYHKTGFEKETSYYMALLKNNLYIKTAKLFSFHNDELLIWAIFDNDTKDFIDLDDLIKELEPLIKMI